METVTRRYGYLPEEHTNPGVGFLSFQHFRKEKLYSDIVVKPENNYTETERVECYPVSADAEENGRMEGYYPDSRTAYIRVLWKEFEPQKNCYNYEFIEKIIEDAKEHGQNLVMRLMAHSTRAEDDVPDWLKKLIPCPERPPMQRVKDSPTDPLFFEYFLKAVRKFAERFDKDPTLTAIDVSFPGAWGEGHNLHIFGDDALQRITDLYIDAFENTRLIFQLSKPQLIKYAMKKRRIGMRGDGYGEPGHSYEKYPLLMSEIPEYWKSAPVSFESYWWLGEWQRRGWDIDKLIELSLQWHISSFNGKSMPIPYEWRDKIDAWTRKMGYHFTVDSLTLPAVAKSKDNVKLTITMRNVGVAPMYDAFPLIIRLKGKKEILVNTGVDLSTFLPGEKVIEVTLPNLPEGYYNMGIGIVGDMQIYLASDMERDGAYYNLGSLTVE